MNRSRIQLESVLAFWYRGYGNRGGGEMTKEEFLEMVDVVQTDTEYSVEAVGNLARQAEAFDPVLSRMLTDLASKTQEVHDYVRARKEK